MNRALFVITLLLLMTVSPNLRVSGATQTAELLPYPGNEASLCANVKGTMLAVIKGRSLESGDYSGESIEIWSLDVKGIGNLLFRDSRRLRFASHAYWSGDHLLYSGMSNAAARNDASSDGTPDVRGYIWSPGQTKPSDFPPARNPLLLPCRSGGLVCAICRNNDENSKDKADNTLKVFSVPTGKLLRSTGVAIGAANITGDTDFVPINLTDDGRTMIGIAATEVLSMQDADAENVLVAIDLTNGRLRRISSQYDVDSILMPRPYERLYCYPYPTVIAGGKVIACALDAEKRNLNYRIQYFNLPGCMLIRELRVGLRDALRANLPLDAIPLSFTDTGNLLLQSDKDIIMFNVAGVSDKPEANRPGDTWLYQMGGATSSVIAKDFYIDKIAGWAGKHRLLVTGRKVIGSQKVPANRHGATVLVDRPKYELSPKWAIVHIP